MPCSTNLIHAVWATKNRRPFMQDRDIRYALFQHMRENAADKGIQPLNLNGHIEHVHALILQSPDETLSKIMNLLKGESSFWAKRNLDVLPEFEWQDDYFSVGVSPSHFEKVNGYIFRQEEHHKRTMFADGYDAFMEYVGRVWLLKA